MRKKSGEQYFQGKTREKWHDARPQKPPIEILHAAGIFGQCNLQKRARRKTNGERFAAGSDEIIAAFAAIRSTSQ